MQIRVVDGPNKGRTYPLDSQEMTIGRARNPGDRAPGWVLLSDDTVSRIQADLHWDEEKQTFILKNRSETNPTKVNGEPLSDYPLKVGDQIRVGSSTLDLQQADFRFGGMAPGPAGRPQRPPTPTPVSLQHRSPQSDNEKLISTKRASRVVSLTTRPNFHLEVLGGPDKGYRVALTGLILALGGPAGDLEEDQERWFDQEAVLTDAQIPYRGLSLVWKELTNAFELTRAKGAEVLPVTLERRTDGTEWIAELPSHNQPVLIRQNDLIYVGKSALHLVVPEAED